MKLLASPFTILFFCSVVMSLLTHGVRTWKRTNESFSIAAATLLIVIAVGVPGVFGATIPSVRMFGLAGLAALCLSLLIYFPPIFIACSHLLDVFAGSTVTNLFLSSLSSPAPSRYGKARKHAIEGDLDRALAEFWTYHRQNPSVSLLRDGSFFNGSCSIAGA